MDFVAITVDCFIASKRLVLLFSLNKVSYISRYIKPLKSSLFDDLKSSYSSDFRKITLDTYSKRYDIIFIDVSTYPTD